MSLVLNVSAILEIVAETLQLWNNAFGDRGTLCYELTAIQTLLNQLQHDLRTHSSNIVERCGGLDHLRRLVSDCEGTINEVQRLLKECSQKSFTQNKEESLGRLRSHTRFPSTYRKLREMVTRLKEVSTMGSENDWERWVQSSGITHKRGAVANDPWNEKVALCLDGSGIRGYASLILLEELVKAIADRERQLDPDISDSYDSPLFQPAEDESLFHQSVTTNDSQESRSWDSFRLCHYFDYICGTSTGGIVAIMLSTMRCTVSETVAYNRDICAGLVPRFSRLSKAFPRAQSRAKNSMKMQSSLRKVFGDADLTSDEESATATHHVPKVVFTTHHSPITMKTKSGRCQTIVFLSQTTSKGFMQPYTIRSYELSDSDKQKRHILNPGIDTTNIPIVDACKATSAAPTWFKKVRLDSVEGSFRDGSICTTNAAEKVFHEINDLHANSAMPLGGLLSMGGVKAPKDRGRGRGGRVIGDLLGHFQQALFDEDHAQPQQKRNQRYQRIVCETTVERSGNPGKMLRRVEDEARRFCRDKEVQQTLEDWAHYLVDLRRRRARTVLWERYAGLSLADDLQHVESTEGRREIWQYVHANGGIDTRTSEGDTTEQ